MVNINFNAAQVKPNLALEAIPSGQYPVIITASEEKPTQKGDGSYIQFEMTIQPGPGVDPAVVGRKVFDRLNIRNPNAQAVDIAYSTLSAICYVTGVMQIQNTQQLHGRPFIAVVIKKARNDQPELMTNEVRGYKDINGNDPGFSGQTAQPSAQPQWAGQQQQPAQQAPQQQVQPVQQTQPQWAQSAAAPQQTQPAWMNGQAPQQVQPQQQAPQQAPQQMQPAQQQAPQQQTPPWAQ